MSTAEIVSECANCGKGEETSSELKACMACKLVKYCNRECQIAHRAQHKKACKKRAAELHDEELFKEHPPRDECPICFLQLPVNASQTTFKACCGKIICSGCIYAMREEARGRGKIGLCAFCREPNNCSDEEETKRMRECADADNAHAFNMIAGCYKRGTRGMPQDFAKANELYLKAGALGCAVAYYNLGNSYYNGEGVEVDKKKAKHYLELAAMNGDVGARYNLGCMDSKAGNYHNANKHFILAAKAGDKKSLDVLKARFKVNNITKGRFKVGIITKEEYADTLRAFLKQQDEMKSDTRDRADELQ